MGNRNILVPLFSCLALYSLLIILSGFGYVFVKGGVIESIDIIWNVNVNKWQWSAYNELISADNILQIPGFISYFPAYLLSFLVGLETAQKLVIFSYLLLAGSQAAYVMIRVAHSQGAGVFTSTAIGLFSALIYGFNVFFLSQVWHLSYLFSYSWFPTAYFSLMQCIKEPKMIKILISGIIVSFVISDPYGAASFLILLLSIYLASGSIGANVPFYRKYLRVSLVMAAVLGIAAVSSSYWVFPYLANVQTRPFWALEKTTAQLVTAITSNSIPIVGSYTLTYALGGNGLGDYARLATLLSFLVPLGSSLTLLKRRFFAALKPELHALAVAMLFGFAFSSGTLGPVRTLYIDIVNLIPLPWLLKFPTFFLSLVSLPYSVLFPLFILELLQKPNLGKNTRLKLIHRAKLLTIIVLAFSLVSGSYAYYASSINLEQKLEPTTIPPEYSRLISFLDRQYFLSPYRTVWLPLGSTPFWANPFANKLEYWLSPVPYISYGFGVTTPGLSDLANLLYEGLKGNSTDINGIIRVMGLVSTRYILVHNDTYPDLSKKLIIAFNRIGEVSEVMQTKYYTLFLNNHICPYVYVPRTMVPTSNDSLLNIISIAQRLSATGSGNQCYMIFNQQEMKELASAVSNATITGIEVHHIGVAHWHVVIQNASRPFVIVLNEPYSKQWSLTGIEGKLTKHILANGLTNGWFINKTGSYSFDIVYAPQTAFETGILFTCTSYIVILVILIFNKLTLPEHRNAG